MNPNNQPKISPEQQAAFEAALQVEHQMIFTKGELLAIFNILTNVSLKYGEYKIVGPIIEKITPIVAVDSNIPKEPAIVGAKNES